MKETEAAGFVRGIDRLTRIVGMPWYSGLWWQDACYLFAMK